MYHIFHCFFFYPTSVIINDSKLVTFSQLFSVPKMGEPLSRVPGFPRLLLGIRLVLAGRILT